MWALDFSKKPRVISFFSDFLSFMKKLNCRNMHFRIFDPLMFFGNQLFVTVCGITFFPFGDFRRFRHEMYNLI